MISKNYRKVYVCACQTAKQPNSQTAKQPNSQTAKQPNSQTATDLGNGLYSACDIKKEEIVFIAKGTLFHAEVTTIEESIDHRHAIGISKETWLDPSLQNPLRYINHSCNPNLGIKGSVTFVALRDIKKDEHLTIDYSITECDKLWNFEIQTGVLCMCGYEKCRKVIKSIQFLPYEIYKKYLPFIPRNFQKAYDEEHGLKNNK